MCFFGKNFNWFVLLLQICGFCEEFNGFLPFNFLLAWSLCPGLVSVSVVSLKTEVLLPYDFVLYFSVQFLGPVDLIWAEGLCLPFMGSHVNLRSND